MLFLLCEFPEFNACKFEYYSILVTRLELTLQLLVVVLLLTANVIHIYSHYIDILYDIKINIPLSWQKKRGFVLFDSKRTRGFHFHHRGLYLAHWDIHISASLSFPLSLCLCISVVITDKRNRSNVTWFHAIKAMKSSIWYIDVRAAQLTH